MSSVRGGGFRGRGRGSGARGAPAAAAAAPGPSSTRTLGVNTSAPRGKNAVRGVRGRGTATWTARGGRGGAAQGGNAAAQPQLFAPKVIGGIPAPSGDWAARQKQLTINREQEKKDAIAQGLMSDPDKAIALSEAITLVGTCQDMCPENERVTRAMRNELWDPEKDENGQADESRMVKRFKRSAAGDEVQLPSDLRPPHVLKRVCDYLFHDLIEDDDSLAKNHHFVWDRTRGVRNDFSVQQISRLDDLRVAIDCFERIARFHIVSLHLLAKSPKPYETYSEQQDREQLDRTLLSLLQYYDDVRGRLSLPNEPEFRAYCIIFQLRDPTPDLEDRVQSWPRPVSGNARVRTALEIYAAACSTMYPEGPMSTAKHVVARQHWERFWSLVISKKVSYLMGCVAEVYFNLLRHVMLNAIVRTARRARPPRDGEQLPPNTDFKRDDLWVLFNFDDDHQLEEFVGRWGLRFETGPDGIMYLDIRHVAGKNLPQARKEGPKQLKSEIVEVKRGFRTIPAVIDGFSIRQAREAGMVGLVDAEDETMDAFNEVEETQLQEEDEDSLFVPEDKPAQRLFQTKTANAATSKPQSAFGQPSPFPPEQSTVFSFGQPSTSAPGQISPFTHPANPTANPFAKPLGTTEEKRDTAANPFSFLTAPASPAPATTNPFSFPPRTTTAAAPAESLTDSAPKTTVSGEPVTSCSPANPFLKPFAAPKPEAAAPKTEETKASPPTRNTGPFLDDDSPTPPSNIPAEEIEATPPIAPPPSWNLPRTSDKTTTIGHLQPDSSTSPKPSLSQANAPSSTTANIPPPINTQNTGSIGQSGPRRTSSASSSANLDQHKPKKPSPLSNSFTACAETAPVQQVKPAEQSLAKITSTQVEPVNIAPPPPDFETKLTELATEFTHSSVRGILKEFLEYTVKNTIEEVHQQIQLERAIEFRRNHLFRNLTLSFITGCEKRRRVRKGRAARERTRRRHAQSQSQSSQASDTASHGDTSGEMFGRFYNSLRGSRQQRVEEQARPGSKRPAAGELNGAPMNGQSHKRSKTSDDADHSMNVTGPVQADRQAEILRQSSFLGYSLSHNDPNRATTTQSTYFRMKAMGVSHHHAPRGTKRPRAASDVASEEPATRPRSSSLVKPPHQARDAESMPPPATRSVRSQTNEDDDALLARLRAAREALNEGGHFMKEAVEKEEEFRRSLSASQSSNESPSMWRARAEARLRRSSQGAVPDYGTVAGARDVPAYRLRQSKFMSAEEQALAVERAREMRASRGPSRENSRPASRMDQVETVAASPDKAKSDAPPQAPTAQAEQKDRTTTNGVDSSAKWPSKKPASSTPSWGFGNLASGENTSQTPAGFDLQPSTADAARNPFSQSSSFAPPPTTSNPFLHATSKNTAPLPLNQALSNSQSSHDNTIPRSQIPEALSHSFGHPRHEEEQSVRPASYRTSRPPQAVFGTISILSDHEGERINQGHSSYAAYGQQQYFENGLGTVNGLSHPPPDEESEDDRPTRANNNRLSYLADDVSDVQDNDGQQKTHFVDRHQHELEVDGRQVSDSYQYSDDDDDDQFADEDDELSDEQHSDDGKEEDEGLMEDADEEDGGESDEEEYDSDEEEGEDGDDGGGALYPGRGRVLNHAYNQHALKQPNPTMQHVGNSAEEAIELSD